MAYMEISSVPKGMLEKFLAESYRATGPIKSGYQPLAEPFFVPPRTASPVPSKGASLPPLPALSSTGGPVSSDLPRREALLPFPPFSSLLPEGGVKDPPGASAGTGPVQKAGYGTLLPADETVEKVKQKRVRKSRASGTPRKRIKAEPAMNGEVTAIAELPSSTSEPPKRRRARAKATTNGEIAEKPPSKRRNRQSASTRKTKEAQVAFSASNGQQVFNMAQHCSYSEASAKGILGVYGLNSKALDLTRYMREISLESLIRGDFEIPSSAASRQALPANSDADESFRKHVSCILQVLSKPANSEFSQPSVTSVSGNQLECKPQKLMLDLETAPQAEDEDFPPLLVDSRVKLCPQMVDSVAENQKPLECQSLFPIETLPPFPLTEFWSTLQLHQTDSLESLLSQGTASVEGRSAPSQNGAKATGMASPCKDKAGSLPPFPFSNNSAQMLHDNTSDRYSRTNYWFRAGSIKADSSEMCFGNLTSALQESRLLLKANGQTDSSGQKEGLMDIDLNKQSPEAEAADTMKHPSMVVCERDQVLLNEQNRMERVVEKAEPAILGEQHKHEVACKQQTDSIGSDANKDTDGSDEALAQKVVAGGMDGELVPVSACDNSGEEMHCEPAKELPKQVLTGDTILSSVSAQRVPELWTGLPCSPRVHTAADILCKMAVSSSSFFINSEEGKTAALSTCHDASSQRNSKPVQPVPSKTAERVRKHLPEDENRDGGPPLKNQVGEGRKKLLSQVVKGFSPAVEKPNALVRSRERSSTPSRNSSKLTKTSLLANNQSSESERSHDQGAREHSQVVSENVHHKVNRVENCQPSTVTSSRTTNFLERENRGSYTMVSRVNSLNPTQTRTATGTVQMRSTPISGTEQPLYGEAPAMIGQPRTSSAKNCFPSQRNVSNYPVKPRNTSSWAIKSVRQIHPFAGEVRQGIKRLETK